MDGFSPKMILGKDRFISAYRINDGMNEDGSNQVIRSQPQETQDQPAE